MILDLTITLMQEVLDERMEPEWELRFKLQRLGELPFWTKMEMEYLVEQMSRWLINLSTSIF
jgi:hypothetical protein